MNRDYHDDELRDSVVLPASVQKAVRKELSSTGASKIAYWTILRIHSEGKVTIYRPALRWKCCRTLTKFCIWCFPSMRCLPHVELSGRGIGVGSRRQP